MKMKIKMTKEVEIKYIEFNIPIYKEDIEFISEDKELLEKNLCAVLSFDDNTKPVNICGIIDIDTGKFINWENTKNKIDIYSKAVDEGKYKIYDNNNKIIAKYEGYVPKFFEYNENGYGDYFNMTISSDGYINNWNKSISYKIKDIENKMIKY